MNELLTVILPLVGNIIRVISDRTKDPAAKEALDLVEQGLTSGALGIEEVLALREEIRDKMLDTDELIAELDARLAKASARIRAVDLDSEGTVT